MSEGINFGLDHSAYQLATSVNVMLALGSSPIALCDPDGLILYWSPGCEALYGIAAENAVGHDKHGLVGARRAIDPASREPVGYLPGEYHLTERHCDGRAIQVLEQIRPMEAAGRPAIALAMTDIAALMTGQRAIADDARHLSVAADAPSVGSFEWDVVSNRLHWSPGSEERLGMIAGEMSDFESWAAHIDPADLAEIEATLDRVIAARAPQSDFTYRLRSAAGVVRIIEGSARCQYDDAGNLLKAVGEHVDVTARKQREAALQEREAQLESILRTVPSAMIVIDESGVIEIASPSAEALFGYRGDEMIGRNVSMLMPKFHSVHHDAYLAAYLTTGERKVIGQNRLMTARHADGHEIPIELRVGEARFGDRRLFTGFLRDQTERLATEQRMDELRGELAHVSRLNAVGEMAAGLAHELNQPLAASTNYLAAAEMTLRQGGEPERVAEMLKSAAQETLRAGEIIRRLRDFVERREVDVRITLVEEALREAASLALVGKEQFETRLDFALDPAAPYMLADRVQVQQVMVNLLRNAIEAMRDRPRKDWKILVGSKLTDRSMVDIYVEDAGPGIDAKMVTKLGQLFATTKGENGLGLGLAICKRIVEAHGGTMWAENRTEGGAAFHFTIPCVRREGGSNGVT